MFRIESASLLGASREIQPQLRQGNLGLKSVTERTLGPHRVLFNTVICPALNAGKRRNCYKQTRFYIVPAVLVWVRTRISMGRGKNGILVVHFSIPVQTRNLQKVSAFVKGRTPES